MAKAKFSPTFRLSTKSEDSNINELGRQVASLTESLIALFQGKANTVDNLNMEIKQVPFASGTPSTVSTKVENVSGARIINSQGLRIVKESIKITGSKTVEIVVEYEGGTGSTPMTVMIFGD